MDGAGYGKSRAWLHDLYCHGSDPVQFLSCSVVLGSIELHQSAFFSSYFLAGYLRRFFPVTPTTNVLASGERLADDNLYTEFLIHSSKVNFFRYLAVKGGVLIPLLGRRGEFDDVQFRITIAVPVGQPIKF